MNHLTADLLRKVDLDAKLAALFKKRSKVATRNFIAAIAGIGSSNGFKLDQGDKCFLHPDDVPRTVHLSASDPVITSTAPAIVKGQLLFAHPKDLPQALDTEPVLTRVTQRQ